VTEIFEKWGFGLAPPKPITEKERQSAAANVAQVLDLSEIDGLTETDLASVSTVKGMFRRIYLQDQWDWFTVCGQMGYPSALLAKAISEQLHIFRRSYTTRDFYAFREAFSVLRRMPIRKCLNVFLGINTIKDEEGAGWIYILSTRELRDLLKIGMTTRTVEERAREINSATGVVIPFGVRSCWRVRNPAEAERLVHSRLIQYRMRNDREFFRLDWTVARTEIADCLRSASQELRTLDTLTWVLNEL
jgi:hypothetical protein